MTDHQPGYRTPARMFHWGVAAAVLLMIPAGLVMTQAGLSRSVQDTLFVFHKNLGTLLDRPACVITRPAGIISSTAAATPP